MDAQTKIKLKSQLNVMGSMNNNFRATMGSPVTPIVAGVPPMPIMLQPVLAPYLAALQSHADEFAKLLKMVEEILDKS